MIEAALAATGVSDNRSTLVAFGLSALSARSPQRRWPDRPHSSYSWGIGLLRSLPTTTVVVGYRERQSSQETDSTALNGAGFDPFSSPLAHTKASPEVIQRLLV